MRRRSYAEALAAEQFYAFLEDWALHQRAQHGEEAAKERLRAYMDGVNDAIKVVGTYGPAAMGAIDTVVAMVQTNALSVECPSCGAQIGDICWSSTKVGRRTSSGSHYDRVRVAMGEHVPQKLETWLERRRKQVAEETAAKKAAAGRKL